MAPGSKPPPDRGAAETESLQRALEAAGQAQRAMEQALRASENRARALLEAASEAAVIIDATGRIVMVNARTETLFGYPREELLGRTLEILVPEQARAIHSAHRSGYAADPHIRSMGLGLDLAGRRKDGTEFPVEISLSYADVEDGRLFMAFVTDITERRRALDALRRSEATARAVLESASEGILQVDAAGHIVSANSKIEQLFGYTRAALIGQPVEILLPERLRNRHAGHRDGFFAAPRARAMGRGLDLTGRRADGSEFPVEISLSYVELEDGIQALAFVSDITQRLATERATRQAERLAALGRLGAGVAHEVNNPIGIINSRIELMLLEADEDGLPPHVVEDLKVLRRHAGRVMTLASNLLSFARESPRERDAVDLNGVVRDALALVERKSTPSAIRTELRFLEPLPPVLGHANALEQVVLNLLTNASQALGEGGTITVTTTALEDRVILEVADDGPGIPSDILPRIFDPFFSTKASGTGLGLSVSYGIIEDHNGTFDVQSEPGRGTVFRITLPILRGST